MVAAPHIPRRCRLRFLLPSRLAPLDGLLGLQYSPPTPRPTGTAAQLERYFHHPSAIARSPWNSPAGKTPYFGAPSNAPAGGYANTVPGAAYNRASRSTIGGVGDTTIPSPGWLSKLPLPGIGLHDPLHGR